MAGIQIYETQLVVIVGAVVMMLILFGIVQWTKIGKAMRAVSEDKEAAELMGINVDRIIVFTFALGGASAGVAGILYTLLFPVVNFYHGLSSPALRLSLLQFWEVLGMYPGLSSGQLFWDCLNRSVRIYF